MRSAVWRTVILALCALAALSAFTSIASIVGIGGRPPWSGRWGSYNTYASGPYSLKVDLIDPGGPADKAGLRTGDSIDIRANGLQERYWIFFRPLNGHPVTVLVRRGASHRKVTLIPEPLVGLISTNWREFLLYGASFYVQALLTLWLAFFAGLIAWRRSNVPEMRLLALSLVAISIYNEVNSIEWAVPWLWPRVVADLFSDVAFQAAIVLSVAFAGYFARPISRVRRIAHRLCYALAAVVIVQGIVGSIGFITLWYDPYVPAIVWPIPGYALEVVGAACAIFAIVASRGVERQRAMWTLVPLALLLYSPDFGNLTYFSPFTLSYFAANLESTFQNLLFFLAPIALTYAALSRRLIDIGFVINRAAVFSAVSIIVVGIFMLGEWVLGTWFSHVSHMTNVTISAALVVALGFSVRAIHTRVDRVLDQVFFRKRHNDETAIRTFANEAAEVPDDVTLRHRTEEMLEAHADASFVTLAMDDGAGHYGDVSENDPAIAALRDRHKVLDLQTLSTELRGEFAYPMIARGKLVGTLVLGPKRSGESYAPDESHAIMQLAREVGAALHNLALAKVLREHHLQA